MSSVLAVSYSDIAQLVRSGWFIRWVGTTGSDHNTLLVQMRGEEEDKWLCFPKEQVTRDYSLSIVEKMERDSSTSRAGIVWTRDGYLGAVRAAAIMGVHRGGNGLPGVGVPYTSRKGEHSMGYDFEAEYTPGSGLPLPDSPIVCASVWCDCGFYKVWVVWQEGSPCDAEDVEYCCSNRELCDSLMQCVKDHSPDWLVGYNCYSYDNSVLKYNCSDEWKVQIVETVGGHSNRAQWSFVLNIPGVYNADLFAFLNKTVRWRYEAMNLRSVAAHHGFVKMDTPVLSRAEATSAAVYNLNDSMITAQCWVSSGSRSNVGQLACASRSHITDCIRYISGTMGSCAVSSYAVSVGKVIDWAECTRPGQYAGGEVMALSRGLFNCIIVCDYSSMYPSIMSGLGISVENIQVIGNSPLVGKDDESFDWDDDSATFTTSGSIHRFSLGRRTVMSSVIEELITQRANTSDTAYAGSLKIVNNSLYGSMGYEDSPLHSPRCASSVTLCGRWAVLVACGILKACGFRVLYGDTDSCMVTPSYGTRENPLDRLRRSMRVFELIMSYTPLAKVRLAMKESSDCYSAGVFVAPKNYCLLDFHGKVITRGLSPRRKDRMGLCRTAVSAVAQVVLHPKSTLLRKKEVAAVCSFLLSYVASGSATISEVSLERKAPSGELSYRYPLNGSYEHTPCTSIDPLTVVPYDRGVVMRALMNDMDRVTKAAGLGGCASILEFYDTL